MELTLIKLAIGVAYARYVPKWVRNNGDVCHIEDETPRNIYMPPMMTRRIQRTRQTGVVIFDAPGARHIWRCPRWVGSLRADDDEAAADAARTMPTIRQFRRDRWTVGWTGETTRAIRSTIGSRSLM